MKKLRVFLAGKECGVLEQSAQGNLSFSYLTNYPSDQTPISISMPPRAMAYPKSFILPFVQGLLPDNESALQAIGSRFAVSYRKPFALLSHVGADVAGALQFLGDEPPEPQIPIELNENEIEGLLREKIVEYSAAIPGSGIGLFSLAGAQPKLALVRSKDSWYTGTSDSPTTHILKPMPTELPDLDLVELMTMQTARELGLKVSNASFMSAGNFRVLLVERYDRKVLGDRVERIHQEDFLQALSISPQQKYQKSQGGPGLKRIAQLLRMIPGPARAVVAREFFAGFSFNILMHATDAHAKNYSLLLDGTSVQLAPLYDLISGAYFPHAQESAISVAGNYRFDSISDQLLAEEGQSLGVKESLGVVLDIRNRLPEAIHAAKMVVSDELPSALKSRLGQITESMLRLV